MPRHATAEAPQSEPCPFCGQPWYPVGRAAQPKKKMAKAALPATADTSEMTEAEMRAYYKRTAPAEDARFALRAGVTLPPDLAEAWHVLAQIADRLPRAEVFRRLHALQDEWRRWRNEQDRLGGKHPVGWSEAIKEPRRPSRVERAPEPESQVPEPPREAPVRERRGAFDTIPAVQ